MQLFKRSICGFSILLVLAVIVSGCAFDQIHSKADHADFSLQQGDLANHGLAFITPSTVTGQEEDKQTLAFTFAKTMRERRPDIRIVTLPETLSAINKADITESYKLLYVDYRDTGVFKRDLLKKVGQVTGTRFLAQLKLSNFTQSSITGIRWWSAGSGHFVKMIHNSIEYGMMQAYAEGFALLKGREDFNLDLGAITEMWRHGSVVRSWLLDLTADFLAGTQQLENVIPVVADTGEERWTALEAIEQGVPAPVMSLALMMRYASQGSDEYSAKLLAKMRQGFGGHALGQPQ